MTFETKYKRNLRIIRSLWGKEIIKYRNYDLIPLYHKIKKLSDKIIFVDESTWSNLDMNCVFEKFDRNITSAGQQYLYHLMNSYKNNPDEISSLVNQYKIIQKDTALRESLQLALMEMKNDHSYHLADLLFASKNKRNRYDFLMYFLSVFSFISLLMIPFINYFIFIALFIGIINIIVNRQYSKYIYKYSSELASLNNLFKTCIQLSRIKVNYSIGQLEVINKNVKVANKITKKIGWLIIDRAHFNDLINFAIEYLNQFFLYELIIYIRSLYNLEKYKKEIGELFEAAASIDAVISIASVLESERNICFPEFTSKDIILEEVYHPLLKKPISNNIHLASRSALITGSNMAGKTTFIKTVGVNVILSQTVGLAFAQKLEIPFLDVYASIKIEDNLNEGKSYFFTEVEDIKRFITRNDLHGRNLFLIDEIFRGTNTLERVSVSASVLKYLNKNNIVLVTTHDIELEDLLREKYEMFNFSEKIRDNAIYFDYKINKGPCSSRNAIKLLELKGYPKEIIVEAINLTGYISNSKINYH